ncbi:hypothetical protein NP233_g10798 [Leucocoprinus birnbaumii]|uniref:Uncharacterized protein n=1 Tax=Leucocoprinus birnbaumii TaxID=56174 RepID=A0AAD5YRK2_9AGAR|nr:hypothetical protein NP233_g10798 [Leucocoprinus birnbaumii]
MSCQSSHGYSFRLFRANCALTLSCPRLPFCLKDTDTTLSLAPQGLLPTTIDARRIRYEQALQESLDGSLLSVEAKKIERVLMDLQFSIQSTITPLRSKDQFIDILFSAAEDVRESQDILDELISEGNAIFLRFWNNVKLALQAIGRAERKLLLFQELMLVEEITNTESRDQLSSSIWSSLTKTATIRCHDQIARFTANVDYRRQQAMGRLDGILLSLQSLEADREFINNAMRSPSYYYRTLQIWNSFQKLSCFRGEAGVYALLIESVVQSFTAELKENQLLKGSTRYVNGIEAA